MDPSNICSLSIFVIIQEKIYGLYPGKIYNFCCPLTRNARLMKYITICQSCHTRTYLASSYLSSLQTTTSSKNCIKALQGRQLTVSQDHGILKARTVQTPWHGRDVNKDSTPHNKTRKYLILNYRDKIMLRTFTV